MSAILDFFDAYKFETYMIMNGFLDLEYPNFDPKHGFLSSVEAEIICLLPNKTANFSFGTLRPSFDSSLLHVLRSLGPRRCRGPEVIVGAGEGLSEEVGGLCMWSLRARRTLTPCTTQLRTS